MNPSYPAPTDQIIAPRKCVKTYVATVLGSASARQLQQLLDGVTLDGHQCHFESVQVSSSGTVTGEVHLPQFGVVVRRSPNYSLANVPREEGGG